MCSKLIKNPSFNKRSKHIQVKYQLIREMVEEGLIDVKYLSSSQMLADVLTKSLSKVKHTKFVTEMGVLPIV